MPPSLSIASAVRIVSLTLASGLFLAGALSYVRDITRPAVAVQPPPAAATPVLFLRQWCWDCHGDGAHKGGLAMDDPAALSAGDWENVRRHLLLHTMPPADEPAPPRRARVEFVSALTGWRAAHTPAPLPVPLRRLNRSAYNQTVSTLFGTPLRPADEFPDDESAHGFDNNADFQPMTPARMERYLSAAGDIVQQVLLPPAPPPARVTRIAPGDLSGESHTGRAANDQHFWLTDGSPVTFPFTARAAGSYQIRITGYAHQAGPENVRITVAGSPPLEVAASNRRSPDTLTATVRLPAGPQTLSLSLANPWSDPDNPDPHQRFRHFLFRAMEIDGPQPEATAAPVTAAFRRVLGPLPPENASAATLDAAATEAVTAFATRAWRRPATPDESAPLVRMAIGSLRRGSRYDEAVSWAAGAALTSPHFLFLTDPASVPPAGRPWAIAARLSYFLWNAPPDEALSTAAATGFPGSTLTEQAQRLLRDPRSADFVSEFAGQWLQTRNTALVRPDADRYPEATPALREDMRTETETFLRDLILTNAPVRRMLDADYTFVNAALAAHYGLPVPRGPGFQRVSLQATGRRGLVGQGAMLLVTSPPTRTSPVLRGKWVLENLLGVEPPPPPPNVPSLDTGRTVTAHSVRAALEQHRRDPACAACHQALDPPGLALQGFDAIGRERPLPPAETTATVFSGETLRSATDLSAWLSSEHAGDFTEALTRRLFLYALGRGLTPREELLAVTTARRLGPDAGFRDFILAVISTPAFRGE